MITSRNKKRIKRFFSSTLFLIVLFLILIASVFFLYEVNIEPDYLAHIIFGAYLLIGNIILVTIGLKYIKKFGVVDFIIWLASVILAFIIFASWMEERVSDNIDDTIFVLILVFFIIVLEIGIIRAISNGHKRYREKKANKLLLVKMNAEKRRWQDSLKAAGAKVLNFGLEMFLFLTNKKSYILSFSLMSRREIEVRKLVKIQKRLKKRIAEEKRAKEIEEERRRQVLAEQKREKEIWEKSTEYYFFTSKHFLKYGKALNFRKDLLSYMFIYVGLFYLVLPLLSVLFGILYLRNLTDFFNVFYYLIFLFETLFIWIYWLKNKEKIDEEVIGLILFLPKYQKIKYGKYLETEIDNRVKIFNFGLNSVMIFLMFHAIWYSILDLLLSYVRMDGRIIYETANFYLLLFVNAAFIKLISYKLLEIYGKMLTIEKNNKKSKLKEEEIEIDETLNLD